jgi:UPF0755 protein
MKKKIFKSLLIFAIVIVITFGYLYFIIFSQSALDVNQSHYLKINKEDNLETISSKLENEFGLKHPFLFMKIAERMNLKKFIKNGRYTIDQNMNLIELIKVLRNGKLQTVNFTIRPMIDLESFVEYCGSELEPDAEVFASILTDSLFLDSIGFNKSNIYSLLLPDTYNLYWHTNAEELLFRLKKEYDTYWNEKRTKKAKNIGLTPLEISILASIVSKESNKVDEMPTIAGMYLNRLKLGMPLQADPTVKFALNDPTIKRILKVHLLVESPYNTYLNKGLPPGPICVPSKQSIEAVLNYQENDFLYMCAKEDFSGYHNFAVNYKEHQLNALRYQSALNQRNIR